MIQRIRSGWNSVRILYLLAGLAITVQAIWTAEWFGLLPGLYFMSMGLFAFGCASGNCALPQNRMNGYEKAGKEK
ncbi:MAG: hypothetical protein IBJ09_13570 [Bacteroidia bacterium]|nr:hypothetical protein [Bacteroidia bacterium]